MFPVVLCMHAGGASERDRGIPTNPKSLSEMCIAEPGVFLFIGNARQNFDAMFSLVAFAILRSSIL